MPSHKSEEKKSMSRLPLSDGPFLQDDIYGVLGQWSDLRVFKRILYWSGRDILPRVSGRTRPPRLSEPRLARAGRNPLTSDHGDAQWNFFEISSFRNRPSLNKIVSDMVY